MPACHADARPLQQVLTALSHPATAFCPCIHSTIVPRALAIHAVSALPVISYSPVATEAPNNNILYCVTVNLGYGSIDLYTWTAPHRFRRRKIMAAAYVGVFMPAMFRYYNNGVEGNFITPAESEAFLEYVDKISTAAAYADELNACAFIFDGYMYAQRAATTTTPPYPAATLALANA